MRRRLYVNYLHGTMSRPIKLEALVCPPLQPPRPLAKPVRLGALDGRDRVSCFRTTLPSTDSHAFVDALHSKGSDRMNAGPAQFSKHDVARGGDGAAGRASLPAERKHWRTVECEGALAVPRLRCGKAPRGEKLDSFARVSADSGCSRSPLSLQLEAFVRRESRVYILQHPHCTRAQMLHIYREVLSVISDQFVEYSALLHVIRDEYDAVVEDLASQVARLSAYETSAKHASVIHSDELNRLRLSLSATIRERETQLAAANTNVHSLQAQLISAERANSKLEQDLAHVTRENKNLEQRIKQLSQRIIDEGVLTGQILGERAKAMDHLRNANKTTGILREEIINLKAATRCADNITSMHLYRQLDLDSNSEKKMTASLLSSSREVAAEVIGEPMMLPLPPRNDSDGLTNRRGYSDAYVHQLITILDRLGYKKACNTDARGESESKENGMSSQAESDSYTSQLSAPKDYAIQFRTSDWENLRGGRKGQEENDQSPRLMQMISTQAISRSNVSIYPQYEIIMEWLRQEGIDAKDIESTDLIIPPGLCDSEDFAFLELCHPVRDYHLSLEDVEVLISNFFDTRTGSYKITDIRTEFKQWIRKQCINQNEADELGFNMLYFCQNNLSRASCKSFLFVLRRFLPEDFVFTWRAVVRDLRTHCMHAMASHRTKVEPNSVRENEQKNANCSAARTVNSEIKSALISLPEVAAAATARTQLVNMDIVLSIDVFCDCLREVFPEKQWSSMLQLRFYLFRFAQGSSSVNVLRLLCDNSVFLALLHRQFLREAEEFILAVVEGVRKLGDISTNRVALQRVVNLFDELDPGATHETNYSRVAEYCRRVVTDVPIGGAGAVVELDTLLERFRSFKLLRRTAPMPEHKLWAGFR